MWKVCYNATRETTPARRDNEDEGPTGGAPTSSVAPGYSSRLRLLLIILGWEGSMTKEQSLDNLWLAQMLFDLGAVQFGNFTLGEGTISSPVYINPKMLIGNPGALRVASKLIQQEINLAQSMRRPKVHPFELVAGVPVGGLLLGAAYSLETNIPLISPRLRPEGTGKRGIEGRYWSGARALIIDDLITRGGSIIDTAHFLEQHDLV